MKTRLSAVAVIATFALTLASSVRAADDPAKTPKAAEPVSAPAAKTVVVTGSLIPQRATQLKRVSTTSSLVSVITQEDIRRSGAASLSDVLRRYPGGR
jgi:outer membrane cobalamin receptor